MANPSQFDAVLFDLDGTVIDTYDLIIESFRYSVKTVLGEDEPVPADELTKTIGTPLNDQIRLLYADRGDDICEEIPRVYREYNNIIHDDWVHEFEGMGDVLRQLKHAGVPLGVVTSKRHAPALQGLSLFDYQTLFDCLVASDDCKHHKPHPEPVQNGAKMLGVDPSKCLYVGDSIYDIRSGFAAGAQTAAVLWGVAPEDVLHAENPTYVCEKPQQLLDVVFQGL